MFRRIHRRIDLSCRVHFLPLNSLLSTAIVVAASCISRQVSLRFSRLTSCLSEQRIERIKDEGHSRVASCASESEERDRNLRLHIHNPTSLACHFVFVREETKSSPRNSFTMSSGFSSSGSASNQAKEGTENIPGSEYSTGGVHSAGMSSSGSLNNQADSDCRTEDDVRQRSIPSTGSVTTNPIKK